MEAKAELMAERCSVLEGVGEGKRGDAEGDVGEGPRTGFGGRDIGQYGATREL